MTRSEFMKIVEAFQVLRAKIDDETTIIYVFNFDSYEKKIVIPIGERLEVLDLLDGESLGIYDGEICFKSFRANYAKALICKKAH